MFESSGSCRRADLAAALSPAVGGILGRRRRRGVRRPGLLRSAAGLLLRRSRRRCYLRAAAGRLRAGAGRRWSTHRFPPDAVFDALEQAGYQRVRPDGLPRRRLQAERRQPATATSSRSRSRRSTARSSASDPRHGQSSRARGAPPPRAAPRRSQQRPPPAEPSEDPLVVY